LGGHEFVVAEGEGSEVGKEREGRRYLQLVRRKNKARGSGQRGGTRGTREKERHG
jgi:hypothetical protein